MEWFAKEMILMMIITNHRFKDDEKIPESELIQMGLRIKRFVNNYRKLVTINVPNKDDSNPIICYHLWKTDFYS